VRAKRLEERKEEERKQNRLGRKSALDMGFWPNAEGEEQMLFATIAAYTIPLA
jgi:hypothetical protein